MLRAKLTEAVKRKLPPGRGLLGKPYSAATDFERQIKNFARQDGELKTQVDEAIKEGNDSLAWLTMLRYAVLLEETITFIDNHSGLITNANRRRIDQARSTAARNSERYSYSQPAFDLKMILILLQVFSYEELLEGASNEDRAKQISFVFDELIKDAMPKAINYPDVKRFREISLGLAQLGYLNPSCEYLYSCPYGKARVLIRRVNNKTPITLSEAEKTATYTYPPDEYKNLLTRLGRDPDVDIFQYNGKTFKDWGSELRQRLRDGTPEVIAEMALSNADIKKVIDFVDDIQNPKPEPVLPAAVTAALGARSNGHPGNNGAATAPVVKAASTVALTQPAKKAQPVQLPKLSKENITSQLNAAEETLKLILQDIVTGELDEETYWNTCNELFGSDYVTQAKPLLNLIFSYIEAKNIEGFANLNDLAENYNSRVKSEYSAVTRAELIEFIDLINKFSDELYDPALQNGIIATDITNGDRNKDDALVLSAYEERLKYPGVSYKNLSQELSQSQSIKGRLGELEITRRLEYKIGLTANDYHIFRAFRELGGNKGIEVTPDQLQRQLDQKHPEYKKDEIADLDARLKDLKKYFPSLLGITNGTPKIQSANGNYFDELFSRPVASWSSNIDTLLHEVYGRDVTRVASDDIRRGYNRLQPRKVAALGLDREIKTYNHQGTIVTIKYADDVDGKPKEIKTKPLTKDELAELIQRINEQKANSKPGPAQTV